MSGIWLMYLLWFTSICVVITSIAKALGSEHPLASAKVIEPGAPVHTGMRKVARNSIRMNLRARK